MSFVATIQLGSLVTNTTALVETVQAQNLSVTNATVQQLLQSNVTASTVSQLECCHITWEIFWIYSFNIKICQLWCIMLQACRRCSHYIFIPHLTPGFNRLCKYKCKKRRETFKFGDLVVSCISDLTVTCSLTAHQQTDQSVGGQWGCKSYLIIFDSWAAENYPHLPCFRYFPSCSTQMVVLPMYPSTFVKNSAMIPIKLNLFSRYRRKLLPGTCLMLYVTQRRRSLQLWWWM